MDHDLVSLRQRLLISAALSVPVAVLSMVPVLQFEYWQWLALTLTAPVAVWTYEMSGNTKKRLIPSWK